MYTHLWRIILEKAEIKIKRRKFCEKSLLQSFLLLAQIPELCVDENDENSSRERETIALEPITDTKLCETMTFVRNKRRDSCKNWKKILWIKNFLRRRVRRRNFPFNASFIGDFRVLSKHTLPKSLNFPFLRASRYTRCLSDYFFRAHPDWIHQLCKIHFYARAAEQKIYRNNFFHAHTNFHLLLPRNREEIIFVHVTIPLS